MAESKVQRVARKQAQTKKVGDCQCGGELVWSQIRPHGGGSRMTRVCNKCDEDRGNGR